MDTELSEYMVCYRCKGEPVALDERLRPVCELHLNASEVNAFGEPVAAESAAWQEGVRAVAAEEQSGQTLQREYEPSSQVIDLSDDLIEVAPDEPDDQAQSNSSPEQRESTSVRADGPGHRTPVRRSQSRPRTSQARRRSG